MIATRFLEHVGHQLRCDGSPTLVLLILSRVGEKGEHRCYPLRACDLASMDHDTKLHKSCVDLPTSRVDNIDIILAH